jgi:streptogramin lyase
MNTRPSHKSLTESHHRGQMRTLRVIAAALTCVVFVHPVIADIPGATLAPVANLSAPVYPRNLAAAPDGKIWYSEERLTPHSVGFFTPDGTVTKFPVPCDQCDGNGTRLAYIESITVGPDGNLWFPYTYVNGDGAPLNGGMNSFIGRFTPAGQFTSFPMPTLDAFRRFAFGQPGHSAITSGSDGNLWFTENAPGKIGKITTAGVITEYPLASKLAAPSIMTSGPDGNLWFTETGVGKIGRITTAGVVSEFIAPRGTGAAGPFGITTGADGNLWYSDWSGAIGRMTPAGVGTRFEVLEPRSQPNNITTGPDGKLYFPYFTFIGTAGDFQGKVAQLDPSIAAPSGGIGFNFTPFPNKEFGNEIVAAPSAASNSSSSFAAVPAGVVPWELYVGASGLDPTAAVVDLRLYGLLIPVPKCDPPITINGQSPLNDTVFVSESEVSEGFTHEYYFLNETNPITPFSASGDVPPGLHSYVNPLPIRGAQGAFGLTAGFTAPRTFKFTLTFKDADGCTATVNITLIVVPDRTYMDPIGDDKYIPTRTGGRRP